MDSMLPRIFCFWLVLSLYPMPQALETELAPTSPQITHQNDLNGALNQVTQLSLSGVYTPVCKSSIRPASDTPNNTLACIDIVDYKFYLPYNTSLTALNQLAVSELAAQTGLFAHAGSNNCQLALLRAICGVVYRQCPNNFVATNTSTWNLHTLKSDFGASAMTGAALPFVRPCASVCDAVISQCGASLSAFKDAADGWLNCTAARDTDAASAVHLAGLGLDTYLPTQGPYWFDSSDDTSVCNAMTWTGSNALPGNRFETYEYAQSGACKGIIPEGATVYIPLPHTVTDLSGRALAPVQPPGVVQAAIEAQLVKRFKALPAWMSDNCHFAYRKYHCAASFRRPEAVSINSALSAQGITVTTSSSSALIGAANVTVYAPKYASRSVCTNYALTCKTFLTKVKQPIPTCASDSSWTADGSTHLSLYPTSSQVVLRLELLPSVFSTGTTAILAVNLSTSPNTLSDALGYDTTGFHTRCPYSAVVPNDPTHPRVKWVSGTGCAASCRAPYFTSHEYFTMDTIVDVALAIGLPLIVIVLFSLVADKQRREKQSLVVMFVFTATMDAFSMVLAQIVKHPIERFCVNNAVPRFQEDGPSLCIAEAVGIQYFLMSNTFAWLSLSVDLFLKVVMEWKSYQGRTFFLINAAWIFGAPLVPLIMGAVRGIYGYNGNQSWCFHRSGIDIKFTWMIFHLHLLIVTCLGFLLMIPVLWKIIVTTGAANEKARDKGVKNAFLFALKRIGKKLKPLRTSLIFVAEKLFFMISLLYYRGLMYYKTVDYVAAVAVWKGCVWKYFDGTEGSYIHKCGAKPHYHIPYGPTLLAVTVVAGLPFLLAIVFYSTILTWLQGVWKVVSTGTKASAFLNPASSMSSVEHGFNSRSDATRSSIIDSTHDAAAPMKHKPMPKPRNSSHTAHSSWFSSLFHTTAEKRGSVGAANVSSSKTSSKKGRKAASRVVAVSVSSAAVSAALSADDDTAAAAADRLNGRTDDDDMSLRGDKDLTEIDDQDNGSFVNNDARRSSGDRRSSVDYETPSGR